MEDKNFIRQLWLYLITSTSTDSMGKIKTRKVKVLETTAKFVTLLFLDQHCQIQLPRSVFKRRRELGLYEIMNPAIIKPAV